MNVEITLQPNQRKPRELQRFLESTWEQLKEDFTEALRRHPNTFTYTIKAGPL